MEFYALNLPQFHRIPENDEWWGEGFTEWTNVKSAEPLFSGHRQPLVPLGGNYYDLSKPEVVVSQHELGGRYGLDGFTYYHYWFNGKLLLEKPIELLLSLPEASLKFNLCWANEPWTRAWDGKSSVVIQPQTFGGMEDWESHITYLYKFFSDPRYQKIEGHPVFYIYSPKNIPQFDQMIEFWNAWLASKKMKSIYLVEFLSSFNPIPYSERSSAVFEFEPLYSSHYEISKVRVLKRGINKKLHLLDLIDYDYLWATILAKHKEYDGRAIIRSGFTNFDNSPRKGGRAFITKGSTPDKFRTYLERLVESQRSGYCNTVLLNAWNEWGEGAILEPTVDQKYAWLEALREVANRYQD